MKINWTLRLQNKATLAALAATVLAFAYQLCGIFGIVPPVSRDSLLQLVGIVLNILVALGVVADPTTSGLSDSARALGYDEPYTTKGK
ncbi:phage holin [Collinsella aerofaciens]|uniref:phage holin n=1 Tax=Collinsella aerofaciens TaxID=74426 RepID=UPI003D78BC5E